MRQIILKYGGECRKCNASLAQGETATYEKRVGIFCQPCAPTDVEEIRTYRQEAADRKTDKYEAWGQKRVGEATATLNHIRERYRGDFAFNTQPGHIPERARVIRHEDRAFESMTKGEVMLGKAERLRHVQVVGDAERKREAKREALDKIIVKGSRVFDNVFGVGTVVGIYSKSYRIKFDASKADANNTFTCARDKSYVRPIIEKKET